MLRCLAVMTCLFMLVGCEAPPQPSPVARITPEDRPYLRYVVELRDAVTTAAQACEALAEPLATPKVVNEAADQLRLVRRRVRALEPPATETIVIDEGDGRQTVRPAPTGRETQAEQAVLTMTMRVLEQTATLERLLGSRDDQRRVRLLAAHTAAELRELDARLAERAERAADVSLLAEAAS